MVRATLSAVVLSAAIGIAPAAAPIAHAAEGDISDTELQAVVTRATTSRTEADDTVAVEVLTSDDAATERTIRELGGVITGSVEGEVVQALVPASQVRSLVAADDVDFVQAPRSAGHLPDTLRRTEALPGTGPTFGEEVTLTNADAWHAVNKLGGGVRVGIVDYFDMALWNTSEQGTKPTVGNGRMFCRDSLNAGLCTIGGATVDFPDGIHGVAVAEIVKDMAPAADVYVATVGTVSDLRAAIDWFALNGVTIITRSLGSAYDGPGDGTGPLASVVDYAVTKNITWFNSAGNDAVDSYMKRSVPTSLAANGYVDFDSGAGTDTWLRLDGGSILMDGVRWANDWYLATAQKTDYSIEFWEPKAAFAANLSDQHWNPSSTSDVIAIDIDGNNTNAVTNITDASQRTGAPPLEAADLLVNPTNSFGLGGVAFMRIKRNSTTTVGSVADTLEIALGRGLTELGYSNAPGSAAKPVVDSKSPGLLAVGAVEPAIGSTIAPYSSQGPTTDGRIKPDMSAPSGLATTVYPSGTFSGTSAAAPTAAGMAALLQGAGLAVAGIPTAALVRHLAATLGDQGAPGPDNLFGAGVAILPEPFTSSGSGSSAYHPLAAPVRALDTRPSSHVGPNDLVGPYPRYSIFELDVVGEFGVPASNVTAVAINLTSVGNPGGFLQAYPYLAGATGATSTVNSVGLRVRANFAVVPVGVDGKISVYLQAGGDAVIDLFGWYEDVGEASTSSDGRFVPLATPERWMDTRNPAQLPTIFGGVPQRIAGNQTVDVPRLGSTAIPSSQVSALVVTLTAVDAASNGWARVMPSGSVPDHTNLNYVPGSATANMSIVPLGVGGRIAVQTLRAANLIIDVVGYITDSSAPITTTGLFVPIAPGRILDTRLPTPVPIASGTTKQVQVTGLASPVVPSNAIGVSANLTVTGAIANGWLKAFPGPIEPSTSTLNYVANQTVAAGTFLKIGALGRVFAKMFRTGHVIIDVSGYFTP